MERELIHALGTNRAGARIGKELSGRVLNCDAARIPGRLPPPSQHHFPPPGPPHRFPPLSLWEIAELWLVHAVARWIRGK
eukprot:5739-Chlamydomonas_euryale.AAC.5